MSIFVKIICFSFYSFQEIETIRPCVYVYTLHSDEVVSLLISGCEKSCTLYLLTNGCCYILCVIIKLLIYTDINPRISLASALTKILNKFSFG